MDYLAKANAKPLPQGYASPESWPEFGALMMPQPISKREWVGTTPRGMRWGVWPLIFEEYVTDKEPDMTVSSIGDLAYNRIVFWKRVARTDIPKGWHVALSKKSWRVDAYHKLEDGTDYKERWNKKARHDLQTWNQFADRGYRVEEATFDAFKEAYVKSTVYKKQGSFLIDMLERKLQLTETRESIIFWVVRDNDRKIIAGTAAHFPLSHNSSLRECPFILYEARECQAATGLMDYWFSECRRRKVSLLLFTYFWQPGEPKSWRGFSTFKSHFATDYVSYPPVLWRFVRGKIF